MASRATPVSQKRYLTPLGMISLFLGVTEAILGVVVTQVDGDIQVYLTLFFMFFTFVSWAGFFLVLWKKVWAFYAPFEYGNVDPGAFVEAHFRAANGKVTTKTADLPKEATVVGNPDHFALLFTATGASWKKSTKAMDVGSGCVVQVSTEVIGSDGSLSVAESIAFVPGVEIVDEENGRGKHLRLKGV